MWERAAKARRVDVDSPSTSRPQVISIESHAQAQSTPSVEHQPEWATWWAYPALNSWVRHWRIVLAEEHRDPIAFLPL